MSTRVPISEDLNPFPWYAQMRRQSPVWRDGEWGAWNVYRYDTVQQVLSDYESFSSQFGGPRQAGSANMGSPGQPFAASMISTDPPRHRQLRALVTQAFTPRAVDALAPRIQAIVAELLDPVMEGGRFDVVTDFATPLPVIVIAEMLGIPPADRARFKHWSDEIVSAGSTGGTGFGGAAREMGMYFMGLIEERRRAPGDDLISGLLAAEIGGERLTLQELLGFGSLLLVAGNETTTNLIGNAIHTFIEHPDSWSALRADPAPLPAAIEEVLRYRSPVQSMYRVAKVDVELDGQRVPAGSFMVAWIGSANHDEAQFPAPERFDPGRQPNRHIAFGHGIHFCLGAPLARLEARIALGAMLERFAALEHAGDAPLARQPSTIVYGLKNLPVKFARG